MFDRAVGCAQVEVSKSSGKLSSRRKRRYRTARQAAKGEKDERWNDEAGQVKRELCNSVTEE